MCGSLGVYQHEKVKKIKLKKHGYKANSFFRHGLDTVRELLKKDVEVWHQYINKFIRWLNKQLTHYQSSILVG
jgi:hypothetical protein